MFCLKQAVIIIVATTQSLPVSCAFFLPSKSLEGGSFHKNEELQIKISSNRHCGGGRSKRSRRRMAVFRSSTAEREFDVKEKRQKEMESLQFIGEKMNRSDPVRIMHSDKSTLSSFFETLEFVSLLLKGNGDHDVQLLSEDKVDDTIHELWRKQCTYVGAESPEPGDLIFMVNMKGMNFSGLSINLRTLIGVKYLKKSSDNSSSINNMGGSSTPEYQIVFIKDSQYAEGPKLLVWIFNKLTGQNRGKSDDEKEQKVHSLSRFTYEVTPDGKSLIFAIKSKLEVVVKFPSLLLKILPVSKEKAEEQGSGSLLKAIEKDVEGVLPKVSDFYTKAFQEITV